VLGGVVVGGVVVGASVVAAAGTNVVGLSVMGGNVVAGNTCELVAIAFCPFFALVKGATTRLIQNSNTSGLAR